MIYRFGYHAWGKDHIAKIDAETHAMAAYKLGVLHAKMFRKRGVVPSDIRVDTRPLPEGAKVIGKCRVCGCTDEDCLQCIERTGQPCHWANAEHTLCSACDTTTGPPPSKESF